MNGQRSPQILIHRQCAAWTNNRPAHFICVVDQQSALDSAADGFAKYVCLFKVCKTSENLNLSTKSKSNGIECTCKIVIFIQLKVQRFLFLLQWRQKALMASECAYFKSEYSNHKALTFLQYRDYIWGCFYISIKASEVS